MKGGKRERGKGDAVTCHAWLLVKQIDRQHAAWLWEPVALWRVAQELAWRADTISPAQRSVPQFLFVQHSSRRGFTYFLEASAGPAPGSDE